MSKTLKNIVQVLSPSDNQLVALLTDAMELDIVESATVFLGPTAGSKINSPDDLKLLLKDAPSDRFIHALNITGSDTAVSSGSNTYPSVARFTRTVYDGATDQPSTALSEVYFGSNRADSPSANPFVEELYPIVLKHLSRQIPDLDPTKNVGAFGVALTQMASASADITTTLAKARADQEKRTDEALAKIAAAQVKQLEANAKAQATSEEAVATRKRELDEREELLENDSAKSEQRKLRNQITADVKTALSENLSDSKAASDFILVRIVAILASAALFYFAYFSFDRAAELVASQSAFSWGQAALLIRASLSFIAGFVLIFWLLQFLRSRIETSRERQIRLERYALDVERGSWVVETLLATRDEKGSPDLPQAWLEGATRNLFADSSTSGTKSDIDPIAALGELLSTGASLKIGNGTSELNLNPKASRSAAKQSTPNKS